MAIRLPGKTFVDPYGGFEDLIAGRIRTPGAASDSFSDDPLRMMRSARFTSQLGLDPVAEVAEAMSAMAERIEIISAERVQVELVKLMTGIDPAAGLGPVAEVQEAMRAMAERIAILPAERVQVELVKLMTGIDPAAGIDLLVRTGIADHVLPEVSGLRLETDEHHRHKDVYQHSLTVL